MPVADRALHEASELLFIPATIVATWSQLASPLLSFAWDSIAAALLVCAALGLVGSLLLYQLLTLVSGWLHKWPVFPAVSVALSGIGLIVLFQTHLPISVAPLTEFTGFSMVAWGFMLDVVHGQVEKACENG
jgi:hypothetical protein